MALGDVIARLSVHLGLETAAFEKGTGRAKKEVTGLERHVSRAGAAIKADMGMGAYAASKAGVHRLTEALATELAGTGVTVNAILPSIIDTPTNRADMPDADYSAWVKPQAIADAIGFLASDQARAITGALIPATRGSEA